MGFGPGSLGPAVCASNKLPGMAVLQVRPHGEWPGGKLLEMWIWNPWGPSEWWGAPAGRSGSREGPSMGGTGAGEASGSVSEEDTLAVCALQTSSRIEGEPLLILN